MPPKKKEEAKPKPLIGRVGTNLKMGIVGLPNAGFVAINFIEFEWYSWIYCFRKSTFFNILTKSSVPAENFPFCTINPNESNVENLSNTNVWDLSLGRVPVPDARFDFLCQHYEPFRYWIDPFLSNITFISLLANSLHI